MKQQAVKIPIERSKEKKWKQRQNIVCMLYAMQILVSQSSKRYKSAAPKWHGCSLRNDNVNRFHSISDDIYNLIRKNRLIIRLIVCSSCCWYEICQRIAFGFGKISNPCSATFLVLSSITTPTDLYNQGQRE